jgi:hypothetical protein
VDFKVPQELAKTSFDHTKINSWIDVAMNIKEAIDYCAQDVKALEFIYTKFSKALLDVAMVNMCDSISIASHAMVIWKVITDPVLVNSIWIPSVEMDEKFRAAYFGGRCGPTKARHDTKFWKNLTDNHFDTEGIFRGNSIPEEELQNELKMLDIVSQYASAMKFNKYPTGVPTVGSANSLGIGSEIWNNIIRKKNDEKKKKGMMTRNEIKSKMFRSFYLVDITPPQAHLAAYLMERDKNGKNRQNNEIKNEKWYSGIDLFEAIRIGYEITKVHEIIEFPEAHMIFEHYITTLFKIKEQYKHDKTHVMYIVSKLLMNSLYGKFGQKIMEDYSAIMTQLPENPEEEWANLTNVEIEMVFDGLKRVGYIINAKKKEEDLKVSYPSYVAACVVAYARRDMSKKLWSIGGYTDPNMTYFYTDTDSMVLSKEAFNKMPKKYIGKNLGQFEDEFPNDKIIAGRFLAPKTYCLAMMKKEAEGYVLAYKVRCKGIPHYNEIIQPRKFEEITNFDEIFKMIAGKPDDVQKKYYLIEDFKQKVKYFLPHFDIHLYERVLR